MSYDHHHLWMPYTQMKNAPEPLRAASTNGCTITLEDGRELIDGIASWWTACHGYNHPHIIDTMKTQLEHMPHIMLGGITHNPALRLAERLAAITPGDLKHVFFADSGSVAIEVALKIAVQYWLNKGQSGRSRFIAFRHAYHGDTMACMSVCDPDEGMHSHFKNYLPQQIIADLPQDAASTAAFEKHLQNPSVAAVIIEPLVQGAGGMKFHSAETLQRVADLCTQHHVLLIADEIFTGFGRTGTMFACEQAGITPDIMCLGKALTGGVISLAATITRPDIFAAFWSDDPAYALMHGPTYMGNPLACAAANASLDLFDSEPRLPQIAKIESQLRAELEPCRNLPGVKDIRVKGAIGVVQMEKPVTAAHYRDFFTAQNVWIRPFADILYLTPSFTITEQQLSKLTGAIVTVLKTS